MKVDKLTEYSPGYPGKKSAAVKLGAIAAAALLAVGTSGCKPGIGGAPEFVDPTEIVTETDPPIPEGEPPVDTETTDRPELVGDVMADPGDGN